MDIKTYITTLCKHCGVDEGVKVKLTDDKKSNVIEVGIDLPEEESGLLIGFHGETLEALQRMVRVTFHEELRDKRFTINVNNYRQQRKEQLEEKTKEIATRILESGEEYTFSYLPSYDRFIVHSTISDNKEFDQLESVSDGERHRRVLTIRPKDSK